MATILNLAKGAKKKNVDAQELQKKSIPGYTMEGERKRVVIAYVDELYKARTATIEANTENRLLLKMLHPDSKCRSFYQKRIEENDYFFATTASWAKA